MDFRSDNTLGSSPEILDAIHEASAGSATAYAGDHITERLRQRCSELFAAEVLVFPVVSGTAGNALAIASMTPPWGAVFCHDGAHIHREELGAVEFFTAGAKLIPIPGANGKLTADALTKAIQQVEVRRTIVPACVSLTNATESGTVYTAGEMESITRVARDHGLRVHLDGARLANALASKKYNGALSSIANHIDILTFGAIKNGGLCAELIVMFRRQFGDELTLRIHRSGHLIPKTRFFSAQFEAYLSNDLWLDNARHANAMADRLAHSLAGLGLALIHPVEANILFVRLPRAITDGLLKAGFQFFDWPAFGPDVYRLVTGFSTRLEDVDRLAAATETLMHESAGVI